MKLKKGLSLLVVAAIMALSMTGCLGNIYTKAVTIDGQEISSGMYLMMQMVAYGEASSKVEDSTVDVLKQTIKEEPQAEQADATATSEAQTDTATDEKGVDATKWIRNRTEELLREYVVVQNKCNELGIELSEESLMTVEQSMAYWDSMAAYYEDNGIGKETVEKYLQHMSLYQQLFEHLYGEGGEKAPTKEEITAAYTEKNAHILAFNIAITNEDGSLKEKRGEARTALEDALEALNSGETTLEELGMQEIPAIYKTLEETTEPTESTEEEALAEETEPIEEGAATEEAVVEEVLIEEEPQSQYISYTDASGVYTADFLASLKEQAVGEYGFYESADRFVLYQKVDTFTTEEEYKTVRDSVVAEMKQEEFEAEIKNVGEQYTLTRVPGAENFLSPKKIVQPSYS